MIMTKSKMCAPDWQDEWVPYMLLLYDQAGLAEQPSQLCLTLISHPCEIWQSKFRGSSYSSFQEQQLPAPARGRLPRTPGHRYQGRRMTRGGSP